jgi:hypothetical protein
MQRNFNTGQEVKFADFNAITYAIEKQLYETLLPNIFKSGVDDAFFGSGFLVSRTDADTVSVAAGLGFQRDSTQTSPQTKLRPLYRSGAVSVDINAAHATLPRIDIISVKSNVATELSETRNFKDETTRVITSESMVVQKAWQADVLYTAGIAAGSPAAPATPTGYVKIAEIYVTAVTGIAATGALTDSRTRIPIGGYGKQYDAVVGLASNSKTTHSTLAAAVAAVAAGGSILVADSEALAATVVVATNNVEIVLAPGVVISNNGAGTGISITGTGCRIKGGKISGFTTAISIALAAIPSLIGEIRFASNTTDINDLSGSGTTYALIQE